MSTYELLESKTSVRLQAKKLTPGEVRAFQLCLTEKVVFAQELTILYRELCMST